jgi:hypothetical protein
MKDEAQPAAARISAATAILDRGHGKPQMHTETTISNANAPTQIELVAFESDYLKRLSASMLSEAEELVLQCVRADVVGRAGASMRA